MYCHLWYLILEVTLLVFFDNNVSSQIKMKMLEAMKSHDIKSKTTNK